MAKVFDLIGNLTQSEKRYLHVQFHFDGDKNYVNLFTYLLQQDTYEEAAIKQHFADEKWAKNVKVVSSYLYKKIMEGLRAYYRKDFELADFWESYANAMVFRKKGMITFFKKEQKHLQQIAKKQGLAASYQAIASNLDTWATLDMHKTSIEKVTKFAEVNIAIYEDLILKEKLHLISRKLSLFGSGKGKNNLLGEVKVDLEHINIKQKNDELQFLYDQNWYAYYNILQSHQECILLYIEKMLKNPCLYRFSNDADKRRFITIHGAYIEELCENDKFEAAQQAFEKYQNLLEIYKLQVTAQIKAKYIDGMINAYVALNRNNFEACLSFFQKQLKKHHQILDAHLQKGQYIYLYANMLLKGIEQKAYQQVYDLGTECFNHFKIKDAPFHFTYAIIFYVIAAYEIDYKFFSNELKNKEYWLKTVNLDKKPYFKLFFSMFRRLHQRIEAAYQSELLLEYQQKFAKLPAEELWGGIIDLWLNGKIADLQAAVEKEKKRKINNMTQKQLA